MSTVDNLSTSLSGMDRKGTLSPIGIENDLDHGVCLWKEMMISQLCVVLGTWSGLEQVEQVWNEIPCSINGTLHN